jgi:hypothetical protein
MKKKINVIKEYEKILKRPENIWILCWTSTILFDCKDPKDCDYLADQIYLAECGYETL